MPTGRAGVPSGAWGRDTNVFLRGEFKIGSIFVSGMA
jgi:hypothetical protein